MSDAAMDERVKRTMGEVKAKMFKPTMFPNGIPAKILAGHEDALYQTMDSFLKQCPHHRDLSTETLVKGAMAYAVAMHMLGTCEAARRQSPIDSPNYADTIIIMARTSEVLGTLAEKYSGTVV